MCLPINRLSRTSSPPVYRLSYQRRQSKPLTRSYPSQWPLQTRRVLQRRQSENLQCWMMGWAKRIGSPNGNVLPPLHPCRLGLRSPPAIPTGPKQARVLPPPNHALKTQSWPLCAARHLHRRHDLQQHSLSLTMHPVGFVRVCQRCSQLTSDVAGVSWSLRGSSMRRNMHLIRRDQGWTRNTAPL